MVQAPQGPEVAQVQNKGWLLSDLVATNIAPLYSQAVPPLGSKQSEALWVITGPARPNERWRITRAGVFLPSTQATAYNWTFQIKIFKQSLVQYVPGAVSVGSSGTNALAAFIDPSNPLMLTYDDTTDGDPPGIYAIAATLDIYGTTAQPPNPAGSMRLQYEVWRTDDPAYN